MSHELNFCFAFSSANIRLMINVQKIYIYICNLTQFSKNICMSSSESTSSFLVNNCQINQLLFFSNIQQLIELQYQSSILKTHTLTISHQVVLFEKKVLDVHFLSVKYLSTSKNISTQPTNIQFYDCTIFLGNITAFLVSRVYFARDCIFSTVPTKYFAHIPANFLKFDVFIFEL